MNESLDCRQLKTLAVLARTGSIQETARHLCVTHSAISHGIRNLESQVGCRLFCKLGKKIMLTEVGEALLVHADRVLAELRRAQATLAELSKWGTRRLRLAAEPVFPPQFLTALLLKFHQEFPQARLQLENCAPGGAATLLGSGAVDLALAAKPSAGDAVEFLPLLADRLHLVVNAGHPLNANGNLRRQDLAGQPCLLFRGCGYHRGEIEQLFLQREIPVQIIGEVDHLDAVKGLIKQTRLASLLPGWVVALELRNRWLISLPLGKKPIEQSWGLLHCRGRPLNHAESALWKYCGQQVAAWG